MNFFLTILSYGLLFIVVVILVSLLLTALCFYLSSKILKNANDKWIYAFKLLSYFILANIIFGCLNFVASMFLSGIVLTITTMLLIVGNIFVVLKATATVYGLDILKSALFILLAGVMDIVIVGSLIFLLIAILPKTNNSFLTSNQSLNNEAPIENIIGKDCSTNPFTCGENGVCIASGECVTEGMMNSDYQQGDCESIPCTNCSSTHLLRGYTLIEMTGESTNYCIECSPFGDNLCNAGFSCYLGKCIKSDSNNPKGVVNCATLPCEGCGKGVMSSVAVVSTNNDVSHECYECDDNNVTCKTGYKCENKICVKDVTQS